MILSVHAIFGAAVASLVPTHPVLGFTLGFASHFVLDAIPHKDYDLDSVEPKNIERPKELNSASKKGSLFRDIVFVSLDALSGLILAFYFFFDPIHPSIFLLGVIGSLIPDGLTFLYLLFKHQVLASFYNFHSGFFHSKIDFKFNQTIGIFLQFCTVAILSTVLLGIKSLF
jgi:hypothetical protein